MNFNQTAEVEGQKITFEKLTVHPTRVALQIKYDSQNSKKILSYEDIAIIDENGEEFGTIKNGISASLIEENRIILYFQSNYFRFPKEIYITAKRFNALDKDKLEVLVDLEKEKLLSKPDNQIHLTGIESNTENMVVNFKLIRDNIEDDGRVYGVFSSKFTDSTGKEYSSSGGGSNVGDVHLVMKNLPYVSPLKLTIDQYPVHIKGDIQIRVK